MITGCQNVSMGYKERGGHCKELGMMQGKGNKISMDIYSFKNRNKYNKTYHTLCTFSFHNCCRYIGITSTKAFEILIY